MTTTIRLLVALVLATTLAACAFLKGKPEGPGQQALISLTRITTVGVCGAMSGPEKALAKPTLTQLSAQWDAGDIAGVLKVLEQPPPGISNSPWFGLIWYELHQAFRQLMPDAQLQPDFDATYAALVGAALRGCSIGVTL